MRDAEVRQRLEEAWGKPLKDVLWRWLVKLRAVSEYQQGEADLEELVDRLYEGEELLGLARPHRTPPSGDRHESIYWDNSPDAVLRNRLFAAQAERDPTVQRFRHAHLAGRPSTVLTDQEAHEWIRQQSAAELLPLRGRANAETLERLGFDVRDWSWQLVGGLPLGLPRYPAADGVVDVLAGGSAGPSRPSRSGTEADDPSEGRLCSFTWRAFDATFRIYVRTDGPLYRLKRIAYDLWDRYGWLEADAVTFVLTGQPGRTFRASWIVHYYLAGDSPRQYMVLTLDPALSPGDVEALYRHIRTHERVTRWRPLSSRVRTLVEHAYSARNGEQPTDWRTLWLHWNAAYPQWAYDNEAAMRRACSRAVKKLLSFRDDLYERFPGW